METSPTNDNNIVYTYHNEKENKDVYIEYNLRDIKEDNPKLEELTTWYKMSGLTLKKFFNTSGLLYKSMELKTKLPTMPEDEQLKLLATDGMLVKRPLVIGEDFVNVSISDIRVEDPLYGAIINPKMWNKNLQRKGIFFLNMQNNDANTGSVFTNVTFKNITVDHFVTNEDNPSAPVRQNIFNGVSETNKMGRIIFDNLIIGGTKITKENAAAFNFIFINVEDVQFN